MRTKTKTVERPRTTVAAEWIPSSGTRHWLCFNDIEVLCLAAGTVTDRMRQQAQQVDDVNTDRSGLVKP